MKPMFVVYMDECEWGTTHTRFCLSQYIIWGFSCFTWERDLVERYLRKKAYCLRAPTDCGAPTKWLIFASFGISLGLVIDATAGSSESNCALGSARRRFVKKEVT